MVDFYSGWFTNHQPTFIIGMISPTNVCHVGWESMGVGPVWTGWVVCFFHLPPTFSGTTWSHQKPRVPTAFAVPGPPADLSIRWSPGTARVVPSCVPPGTTAELRGVPLWVKPAMPNAEASLESPTLEVMPIYWNLRISIICEPGSQDLDNQIPFCHSLTPKILSRSFA